MRLLYSCFSGFVFCAFALNGTGEDSSESNVFKLHRGNLALNGTDESNMTIDWNASDVVALSAVRITASTSTHTTTSTAFTTTTEGPENRSNSTSVDDGSNSSSLYLASKEGASTGFSTSTQTTSSSSTISITSVTSTTTEIRTTVSTTTATNTTNAKLSMYTVKSALTLDFGSLPANVTAASLAADTTFVSNVAGSITSSLGVDASNVTITKIELVSRRLKSSQARQLYGKKLKVEFEMVTMSLAEALAVEATLSDSTAAASFGATFSSALVAKEAASGRVVVVKEIVPEAATVTSAVVAKVIAPTPAPAPAPGTTNNSQTAFVQVLANSSQNTSLAMNTSLENVSNNFSSLKNTPFAVDRGPALDESAHDGNDATSHTMLKWAIGIGLLVILFTTAVVWVVTRRRRSLSSDSYEEKADLESGLNPAIALPVAEAPSVEDVQDKDLGTIEDTDSVEVADVCCEECFSHVDQKSTAAVDCNQSCTSSTSSRSGWKLSEVNPVEPLVAEDESPNHEVPAERIDCTLIASAISVPTSDPVETQAPCSGDSIKTQDWAVFSFARSWFAASECASCARPSAEEIHYLPRTPSSSSTRSA